MTKKTAIYDEHLKHGGKMVEYAGFLMPVQYGKGILSEVRRVRKTVGVFDVSHMGEVEVSGSEALDFVNYLTINDASELEEYQVQYSAMCYEDGGIVDDLLVYRLPDRYLLVVNAANTDKDYAWITKQKKGAITLKNTSDEVTQLAIQGPDAEKVVQRLTESDLSSMEFYWSNEIPIAGTHALVSRTGYTGEDGFEIYCKNNDGARLWREIFSAGESCSIEPVGLGARDLLRLEMKYCLYGNDIDKTTNPLEAGLSWITKLDKDDFIGREALLKQKEAGIAQRLICFEMEEKGMPRHHYKILKDEDEVGMVTSGNYSPSVEKYIGMGYLKKPFHKSGTKIQVDIRGSRKRAVVVKPPFYKHATHK